MTKSHVVALLSLFVITCAFVSPGRLIAQEEFPGCQIGGPGSDACSIGYGAPGAANSCSVTCMEGYYACCNLSYVAFCKCVQY